MRTRAIEPEPTPEKATVEATLVAWRGRATNIFLLALAIGYVPVFVAVNFTSILPLTPIARALEDVVYFVFIAGALLRRVDYRRRLPAFYCAAYLGVAVANLARPAGPGAHVGVVTAPIFVLVLSGVSAARRAILASAVVLISAPLLRQVPAVARTFTSIPMAAPAAGQLGWVNTVVMGWFLAALMILLDRFHRFLLDTLDAQYRAKAELERETLERAVAQRKVEKEMRERQRLEREIASVSDAERRRLGHELHDGVCQQVTAALLRCQALERRLGKGAVPTGADFQVISSLLAETVDDAHSVAMGLCPLEPDPEALAPALRALTKRTQELAALRCEFFTIGDVRVPDASMAQHLYRIAQEALSNAVRHAQASRITVDLRADAQELTLQVEDDGVGLPPEPSTGGMGLRTMAIRAELMAGKLIVAPAAKGGTCVRCRVPRPDDEPDSRKDSGGEPCVPAP